MKLLKILIPASFLLLGLYFHSLTRHEVMHFSNGEKIPCSHCHVAGQGNALNEAGKYYKANQTLAGAPAHPGQ